MLYRLAAALTLMATPIMAEEIKMTTWNIEHLRETENTGALKRSTEDYDKLIEYAKRLNSDIIALQEVDGEAAAARVFPEEEYDFYFSGRNNVQRTGFAVRKSIQVIQNPDVEELGIDGNLRYGTDITVKINGSAIRILSVHLKSGCFDKPLSSGSRACRRLKQQIPVLEDWIDARVLEGIPFALLGDFNRRFDIDDDFADASESLWQEIDDSKPEGLDLTRTNEDIKSNCWGGNYPVYIDHLVFDGLANSWVQKDTFEQLVFDEADSTYNLSDHCPISVSVNFPSNLVDFARAQAVSNGASASIETRLKLLENTGSKSYFANSDRSAVQEILDRLTTIENRLQNLEEKIPE